MELASPDLASPPASKLSSLLASSDAKRAAERAMLLYTPVWGAVTAVIMMSGAAERWGDLPLFVFGASMMVGAIAAPFLARPASERALPLHEQTATKMVAAVVLLSFGLNYTQTPFFWEVLHMHYGFHATWTIDSNPIFLYALTVAYFSTYSVLCTMAFRFLSGRFGDRPWGRVLAFSIAPFAMAFLETALNANPFTTKLFCYDDVPLVLTFGTFGYGIAFVLILPLWVAIDEREGKRMSLLHVVAFALAALYLDLIALDFLQANVAPHLTNVVAGARGLRDVGAGCLVAP